MWLFAAQNTYQINFIRAFMYFFKLLVRNFNFINFFKFWRLLGNLSRRCQLLWLCHNPSSFWSLFYAFGQHFFQIFQFFIIDFFFLSFSKNFNITCIGYWPNCFRNLQRPDLGRTLASFLFFQSLNCFWWPRWGPILKILTLSLSLKGFSFDL